MNRRNFISSLGATVSVTSLAGCSAFDDTDQSNDLTESPSDSPTDTETASPVDVEEYLESARTHLNAAFDEIHSMNLYYQRTLRISYDGFEAFDFEKARSHVENARSELEVADRKAPDDSKIGVRIAVLKNTALVAEQGALLYKTFRKAFANAYKYIDFRSSADLKPALKRIRKAIAAIDKFPSIREDLFDGLLSISNAPVDPEVEKFDFEVWGRIEAGIDKHTPALTATFRGFQSYTQSTHHMDLGITAYQNGNISTAQSEYQIAIDRITTSRQQLGAAQQRGTSFFQAYRRAFICRGPGIKDSYQLLLNAANEKAKGNDEKAEDFMNQAYQKMGEAVDSCPVK